MERPARIEAVVQALESQLDTIQHYYDLQTGEVVMVSEEFGTGTDDPAAEAGRYLHIPPLTNNERFQIMEDFVESLPNENLQEELNQALIEKGAFQRFEEVLKKYPNRREQWRRFRAGRVTAHARQFLRAHGIGA